jgi:hypothetical protein
MTSKNRFYDIHMHVFNLSHAGLMAFINRFFLNNALDFSDLLKGRYLKILRHYFFKKGHSREESRALMRRRRIRVSVRVTLILTWMLLWFYFIPKHLHFNIPEASAFWDYAFSVMIYISGFIFSPILLFIIYLLLKALFKKIFCKKKTSSSISRSINVLSIFENDLAHQLRYLEMDYLSKHDDIRDYIATADNPEPADFYAKLQELWDRHNGMLMINGQEINKVILTPLMMNFNSKGFEKLDKALVHYNLPPAKLIIEQLVDLFNGIQAYSKGSIGLMEVYPFMGINPGTYRKGGAVKVGRFMEIPEKLDGKVIFLSVIEVLVFVKKLSEEEQGLLFSVADDSIKQKIKNALNEFHAQEFKNDGYPKDNTFPKMLDKYFGDYKGDAEDFSESFEKTFIRPDGPKTWRDIGSNFFSGIKVYPPLGFDPYPKEEDFDICVNTHYLYDYCVKKNIPLTTHCSDGGFVIMDERWSRERANPEYWAGVLHFYPKLKLNFGHFGVQHRSTRHGWGRWNKTIIDLILNDDFPNVYSDISDLGATHKEYDFLGKAIREAIRERVNERNSEKDLYRKLYSHLLFGTDFMVNLFNTESYLAYLNTWEETGIFEQADKVSLASENAHRFLFGS